MTRTPIFTHHHAPQGPHHGSHLRLCGPREKRPSLHRRRDLQRYDAHRHEQHLRAATLATDHPRDSRTGRESRRFFCTCSHVVCRLPVQFVRRRNSRELATMWNAVPAVPERVGVLPARDFKHHIEQQSSTYNEHLVTDTFGIERITD